MSNKDLQDTGWVDTTGATRTTSLTLIGNDGVLLFSILPDGTIERGPAFTTEDEMSLRFWEMISQSYPDIREQIRQEVIQEVG